MKKTLMVLSFALCASFAFAQTKSVMVPNKDVAKMDASKVAATSQSAGYTGSIFTKDDVLFNCGFLSTDDASVYTTGRIQEGDLVNGEQPVVHQQTAFHSTWRRFPSNDTTAILNSIGNATNYPASYDMWGHSPSGGRYYSAIYDFASTTASDGIMVMTMQDALAAWNGTGAIGNFDAFIKFGPINTSEATVVRLNFYQFYRCNNADKCYVDYSADGNTWSSFEINVRNVDVGTHALLNGWRAITMPLACGNQNSLYFRLRWQAEMDGVGYYGWFWYVDDVSIEVAPQNSLRLVSNQRFEGFYQMMPQNLQVPVVWAAEFVNDGSGNQTNFSGAVYTYSGNNAATTLVSKSIGTVNPDPSTTRTMLIDPNGFYDSTADYHGWGFHPDNFSTDASTYACLPTANTGDNYYFTDLTTDYYTPHIYSLNTNTTRETFDTVRYDVNWDATAAHPYGVWARDNGVVSYGSYYATGLVGTNTYSTDPDETRYNETGYSVMVSYVTGNTIPTDVNGQPWRILGVEMTASTRPGLQNYGARLNAMLYADSVDLEDNGSIFFRRQDHGASTYTVKPTDVISTAELGSNEAPQLEYELYGSESNPTIRIMFPNQPVLKPGTAYRIGYQLAEDEDFALSTAVNGYYKSNGRYARFDTTAGMQSYANILPVENYYSVLLWDPFIGNYRFLPADAYPMIRMIVGPYYYVPKYAITIECEDAEKVGFYSRGDFEPMCGTVDSIAEGAAVTYYLFSEDGYTIDKVFLDGQEIEWEVIHDEDNEDEVYGAVTIENITAPHTLRCTYKEGQLGFDPVANVSMRLMPNPATSNVNVVMKGVTGTVNMALIDMSGRVVTTSQFNAENGTNINVSNLAKGAYFVRITNSKFSKIEKLIVR